MCTESVAELFSLQVDSFVKILPWKMKCLVEIGKVMIDDGMSYCNILYSWFTLDQKVDCR